MFDHKRDYVVPLRRSFNELELDMRGTNQLEISRRDTAYFRQRRALRSWEPHRMLR